MHAWKVITPHITNIHIAQPCFPSVNSLRDCSCDSKALLSTWSSKYKHFSTLSLIFHLSIIIHTTGGLRLKTCGQSSVRTSDKKMAASISERCRSCISSLKSVCSAAVDQPEQARRINLEQAKDNLERLSLWMGNIGARHAPKSPLSLESRLRNDGELLGYIHELLGDLAEVAGERTYPYCSVRYKR